MALPLFYPADCLPAKKEETDLKRWHTDPAGQWVETLPIEMAAWAPWLMEVPIRK